MCVRNSSAASVCDDDYDPAGAELARGDGALRKGAARWLDPPRFGGRRRGERERSDTEALDEYARCREPPR